MFGLIYFGALGGYIALSIWLTAVAVRSARERGKAGWKWGVPTALAMYLLLFWDLIPTATLHAYYCKFDAGVRIHKSSQQWMAEHNDEVSEIRPVAGLTNFWLEDRQGYWLNSRFRMDMRKRTLTPVPVHLNVDSIVDGKTEEVLVEAHWVSAGYPGPGPNAEGIGAFKFWTKLESCVKDSAAFTEQVRSYRSMIGSVQ